MLAKLDRWQGCYMHSNNCPSVVSVFLLYNACVSDGRRPQEAYPLHLAASLTESLYNNSCVGRNSAAEEEQNTLHHYRE